MMANMDNTAGDMLELVIMPDKFAVLNNDVYRIDFPNNFPKVCVELLP
jgi:hypothetical protein